jgi:DNA-binding transcriptional regulator YdaS (Cro superfamily)
MPPDRRTGWTRTSERAGSACSLPKRVGRSSVLRSRWMFRLHCGPRRFSPNGCNRIERAAAGRTDRERQRPALRLYADSGYTLIKGYCSLMLPLRPYREDPPDTRCVERLRGDSRTLAQARSACYRRGLRKAPPPPRVVRGGSQSSIEVEDALDDLGADSWRERRFGAHLDKARSSKDLRRRTSPRPPNIRARAPGERR